MDYTSFLVLVVILLLSFIIYIFKNPVKIDLYKSIISGYLTNITDITEKDSVSSYIQYKINNFSSILNKEASNVIPYNVKIEWVSKTNRQTFIDNDQIILRLEYHNNNSRNIVNATLRYLEIGLIPHTRKYIHKNILDSIDYTVAKKQFINNNEIDALQYFVNDIIDPRKEINPELGKYLSVMSNLDEQGFFTRLLLNELNSLGYVSVSPSLNFEIEEFVNKLSDISSKKKGVDIDAAFYGDNIKMAIVYIAKYQTLQYGFTPYMTYINKRLEEGYETFYLLARGKYNVKMTEIFLEQLEKTNKLKLMNINKYSKEYEGRKTQLICINMRRNNI